MNHVTRLLCIFVLTQCSSGARLLGIFHMPVRSHYILGSTLMKALAEKGHDVTMISPYGEKSVPKHWKYRDIVLTGYSEEYEDMHKYSFRKADYHPFYVAFWLPLTVSPWAERTLNHSAVQDFLKSDEKFDVVILENFQNDALKAFAPHFGASLIMFNTMEANHWINNLVCNPSNPSYVPEMALGYSPKMNLWQRLINSIYFVLEVLVDHWIYYPLHEQIARKYFEDDIDLSVTRYNVSLALLNSHASIHQSLPLLPNMIEIAGFHISVPEPLPKDLQELMDDANEGVVYFSMGSNLRSKYLPTKKKEAILKTFSKLNQMVLWKCDDDFLPGQPQNVILRKWFPQQSILAHPNVKLFISQGGILSISETIYHGIPIIIIPIYGDQFANAAKAVQNEYGVTVSLHDLNEEILTDAIHEILNNTRYAENAKTRSRALRDRPIKPLDEAIYWIEYVIRQKGAIHFRSSALDLAWYQYFLLDVIVVIILGVKASVILLKYILRTVLRRSKRKKAKTN